LPSLLAKGIYITPPLTAEQEGRLRRIAQQQEGRHVNDVVIEGIELLLNESSDVDPSTEA
jgi:hypothetical protein